MINVALIDDHIVVRSGFAQLLSLEKDIRIIGEYGSAVDAWANLPDIDVRVAVMDISMPDESGLSLLKRLRQKMPHFRAIILSIYDTTAFVQSAMDAGASGYLTKRCGPDELVQALRTVNGGGLYLCADALRALRHMPQQPQQLAVLTPAKKKFSSCWSMASVSKPLPTNCSSAIRQCMFIGQTFWANSNVKLRSSWSISRCNTSC